MSSQPCKCKACHNEDVKKLEGYFIVNANAKYKNINELFGLCTEIGTKNRPICSNCKFQTSRPNSGCYYHPNKNEDNPKGEKKPSGENHGVKRCSSGEKKSDQGEAIQQFQDVEAFIKDKASTDDSKPVLVKTLNRGGGFLGKLPSGGLLDNNGEPLLLILPCSKMTQGLLLEMAKTTGSTSKVHNDPHRIAKSIKGDPDFHASINKDLANAYPDFGKVHLSGEAILSTKEKGDNKGSDKEKEEGGVKEAEDGRKKGSDEEEEEGGVKEAKKKSKEEDAEPNEEEGGVANVRVETSFQSRQPLHTDVGIDVFNKGIFQAWQASLWAPANEEGAWIEFLVKYGEDFGRMAVWVRFGSMVVHNCWHAGTLQDPPSNPSNHPPSTFAHRYFCYIQNQEETQSFTKNMLHNVIKESVVGFAGNGLGPQTQKAKGTTRATIDSQVPQAEDLDRYVKKSTGWTFADRDNKTYKLGRVYEKGYLIDDMDVIDDVKGKGDVMDELNISKLHLL